MTDLQRQPVIFHEWTTHEEVFDIATIDLGGDSISPGCWRSSLRINVHLSGLLIWQPINYLS